MEREIVLGTDVLSQLYRQASPLCAGRVESFNSTPASAPALLARCEPAGRPRVRLLTSVEMRAKSRKLRRTVRSGSRTDAREVARAATGKSLRHLSFSSFCAMNASMTPLTSASAAAMLAASLLLTLPPCARRFSSVSWCVSHRV